MNPSVGDEQTNGNVTVPTGKHVPINFLPFTTSLFANNLIVQRDENTVYLSFYQITPPMILGDSENDRRQLFDELLKVDAHPVARIAIPLERLGPFLEVLQSQAFKEDSR